jgi:hypothetical protein
MEKEKIKLVEAVHKPKKRVRDYLKTKLHAVFRESAKGMGKLMYNPHEAYEDELKMRLWY